MRAHGHIRVAACLLLGSLTAIAACGEDVGELTQVTARVYVEPQVRDAMQAVRLRLSTRQGDAWVKRELVDVPAGEIMAFPFEVPIMPRDGDTDTVFEIVIDALDSEGEPLVQARAITGFVAGEVRVLELWLEVCGDRSLRDICESDPDCYGNMCAVCAGSQCVAETPFTSRDQLLPLSSDALDPNKINPRRRETGDMPDSGVPDTGDPMKDGGTLSLMDASEPDPGPCDDDPCDNGGECKALAGTGFECACTTGYLGATCQIACDVTAAAGPATADEENHVLGAALYMSSQRSAGVPATCGTACSARHAADGERCGETDKAPIAQPALMDAGERFVADWSKRGARRIDRIEIYNVRGAAASALDGAQILVDGFTVGVVADGAASHAVFFDPPLYGSRVEVVQAGGAATGMGLAEVEVWGKRNTTVRDVALFGAARQSSVLAVSEAKIGGGAMAHAGPANAVDGSLATQAATKSFLRSGSVDLEALYQGVTQQAYPYGTGNLDDVPLVGVDNAWWLLDLGRPQRLHAVHVYRGDNPQRLAGAKVYLVVNDVLEAAARWTLPATASGAFDVDRLHLVAPIADVTGVKIVSALASIDATANQDPNASLELREVRVWADTPLPANEPLRDLSVSARADMLWTPPDPDSWPAPERSPGSVHDGDMTTGASSSRVSTTSMHLRFGAGHEVRYVEVFKHPSYPGNFFYTPPGQGCPYLPLCGDTYGTCSRRSLNSQFWALGENGGPNNTFTVLDETLIESFAVDMSDVFGIQVFKAQAGSTATAACPSGYGHEGVVNLHEVRVLGYPPAAGPSPINHARLGRGATGVLSPPVVSGGETFPIERAINGWDADYAATEGSGAQELMVTLRRPVRAQTVRVVGPLDASVDGATLEVLVDGGVWVQVATLAASRDQSVALDDTRLIAAVRLRHMDAVLQVGELEVLAPPGR